MSTYGAVAKSEPSGAMSYCVPPSCWSAPFGASAPCALVLTVESKPPTSPAPAAAAAARTAAPPACTDPLAIVAGGGGGGGTTGSAGAAVPPPPPPTKNPMLVPRHLVILGAGQDEMLDARFAHTPTRKAIESGWARRIGEVHGARHQEKAVVAYLGRHVRDVGWVAHLPIPNRRQRPAPTPVITDSSVTNPEAHAFALTA